MKIKRLLVVALFLGIFWSGVPALAWEPPGPVKLMIGFAAGGGADTQTRMIAEELEKRHGWKIIPEQVTGKGGLNLAAAMKDQPADGTAIGIVISETLGYNMVAANAGMEPGDFTPIVSTAGFQMAVVAKSDKGWNNIDEMFAAGKGGQDLRFGVMSPKLGDLAYLLGKANGVDLNIVTVKGGKAVMNGVNAGDLDVGFMAGIQAKGVAAGDLVNLASAIGAPLAQTPEVPTLEDLGVPFNAAGFFLFIAPAGLSDEARDAIGLAIAEIISDETTDAAQFINKAFGGPLIIAGEELSDLIATDWEKSGELLKAVSE